MREIRFRVWDSENTEWFPRDLSSGWVNICPNGEIVYGEVDGDPEENDGRFEVSMFTGLKDKNGNEIYDGDIVKGPTYSTCTGPGYRSTRTKEIVFEVKSNIGTYGYAFTISGNYDNNYRGFPRHEELEIIGNIYENKELLEDSHAK
jgi:hypothetical protein